MKLFLSYRRTDTQAVATYTAERLATHQGIERVFLDVHDMEGGRDWEHQIETTLREADATLVLIGEGWRSVRNDGTARIDDNNDTVRREVRLSLQSGKPVYVALIDGCPMPLSREVPRELERLVTLHAWAIRSDEMRQDVDALARRLAPAPTARAGMRPWPVIQGVVVAAALLVAGAAVHRMVHGRPLETSLGSPTAVWLVIVGALVVGALSGAQTRR